MSNNPEDYELFHYDVKGMKWDAKRAESHRIQDENSFVNVPKANKSLKKSVRKDLAVKSLKDPAWTNQTEGKARVQKLFERHNSNK